MIIQMIFSSNGNVFGFVSPFTAKIAVRGLNTGSFMKASVELLSFLWEWIYSQWISHLLTSSLVVNRDARAVAKRQQKEIRKPDENDNHEVFACNACDLSKGVYIYIYILPSDDSGVVELPPMFHYSQLMWKRTFFKNQQLLTHVPESRSFGYHVFFIKGEEAGKTICVLGIPLTNASLEVLTHEPCSKFSCIVSWFEVTFKQGFEGFNWKRI